MNNLKAIYENKKGLIAVIGWLLFAAVMITNTVTKEKCEKAQAQAPAPVVEMKK